MSARIEAIFHINIVCRSLDRSLPWYTDVLGMKIAAGPYDTEGAHLRGVGMGAQMWGVEPEDVRIRFALLKFDGSETETAIDLLEWVRPRSYGAPHPTLQQVGLGRVGLRVDDIDAVYEDLLAKGAQFTTPPIEAGGTKYACFQDPDGTFLQLYSPGVLPG